MLHRSTVVLLFVACACGQQAAAGEPDTSADETAGAGGSSGGTGGTGGMGGSKDAGTAGRGGTATDGGAAGRDAGGAGSGGAVLLTDAGLPETLRAGGKLIGAAISAGHLDDQAYADLAGLEFNFVTPENEMKWGSTEPQQGNFTFANADKIVSFAEAHGMKIKGHTLVWHQNLPGWVSSLSNATDVRAALTNHIQGVVGHFKGKILSWDVVNEAIDDSNGNPLRDTVFKQYLGDTYIDEAFQIAHAADPDALLFYNDYGIEGMSPKATVAATMLTRMLAAGVPVHGVGVQAHTNLGGVSAKDVATNLLRFSHLGLKVNISELDISLCDGTGDDATDLAAQSTRYHDLARACYSNPQCMAVSLWGVVDKYSWLNSFAPCATGPRPLPFDDNYQRKPAWTGLATAIIGK